MQTKHLQPLVRLAAVLLVALFFSPQAHAAYVWYEYKGSYTDEVQHIGYACYYDTETGRHVAEIRGGRHEESDQFSGNPDVTGDLVIPDYVELNGQQYAVYEIRDYAFEFTPITSVTFPSTLYAIGSAAFRGCENLKTVNIPDNVEVVDKGAFQGCTHLRTVYIGSGIEYLGSYHPGGYSTRQNGVFKNCTRLTDVYIKANPSKLLWNQISVSMSTTAMTPYEDSDEFKPNKATLCHVLSQYYDSYVNNCSNVNVTFVNNWDDPVEMELIDEGTCGESARWELRRTEPGAQTLKLEIIGTGAMADFSYISGTSNLATPWYDYRQQITELEVGEGITRIGDYAFGDFYKNNDVLLPTTLKEIGYTAFRSNSSLQTLSLYRLPQLETIESYAFQDCSSLESLSFPKSLQSLAGSANAGTTASLRVHPDNPVYYAGDYCIIERATKTLVMAGGFYSGAKITIPAEVEAIGDGAFWNAEMASVVFPAGLKSIGNIAFTGCNKLTEISFPEGLESIGNWAFQGCSQLRTVSIYAGLKTLGVRAFQGCQQVTDVYCYSDPAELQWLQYTDRGNFNPGVTKMHVLEDLYEAWVAKYSGACVTFIGDQTAEDAKDTWAKFRNKEWPKRYYGETYETHSEFVIDNPEDLAQLAYMVNVEGKTFEGKTITVSSWNDMDLSAHEWTPIGGYFNGEAHRFMGTFKGSSSSITGVRVNAMGTTEADCYKGLFGLAKGATIQKVKLTNSLIIGNNNTAAIVGHASEGCNIINCFVDNTVTVRGVASSTEDEGFNCHDHGGIVGNLYRSTVAGCISMATVDMVSNDISGYFRFCEFGAIVGNNQGTVKYCLALGAKVEGRYNVGIIAGVKNEDATGTYGAMINNYYSSDCSAKTGTGIAAIQKSGAGIGVGYISEKGALGKSGFYDVIEDNGAQMSAGADSQPSYIGDWLEESNDFGWLTLYTNGLYLSSIGNEKYNYKYFFVERPEITTITEGTTLGEEVVINTDNLETEETLENVEVNNVYYNLDSEGGSGYDSTDGSIVIAESTDMDQINDAEPGSSDVRQHFNGLIIKVAKGTGTVKVKVKTTGGAKLAMKVGDSPATIVEQTVTGEIEKAYDVMEDTYLYIYAVDVAAAPARGRKAPADSGVEIFDLSITPITNSFPTIDQYITYKKGWQWISTYLREAVPVTTPYYHSWRYDDYYYLKDLASRILSQTQELVYDEGYNKLIGNIKALQPGQAYKVLIDKSYYDDDFEYRERYYLDVKENNFHKYSVVADPLHVYEGWTWINYPNDVQAPFGTVLKNAEAGDVITGHSGYATFDGTTWEGSITDFVPGQGYIYKSVSDKYLQFDFSSIASTARAANQQSTIDNLPAEEQAAIRKYPNTMNITARIHRFGQEQPDNYWQIRAYDAEGELRGISKLCGQNHYLTVHGEDAADISFAIVNTHTGETYGANEMFTFSEDVIGTRQEPFVFTIGSATGIDEKASSTLAQPSTVYDLQGRRLDGTSLPKGTYIVNGKKHVVK